MELTVADLLYKGLIWNKEKVQIKLELEDGTFSESEIKRLEFQYDAIDNDYIVSFIEPEYDEVDNIAYLIINCCLKVDE